MEREPLRVSVLPLPADGQLTPEGAAAWLDGAFTFKALADAATLAECLGYDSDAEAADCIRVALRYLVGDLFAYAQACREVMKSGEPQPVEPEIPALEAAEWLAWVLAGIGNAGEASTFNGRSALAVTRALVAHLHAATAERVRTSSDARPR